MEASTHCPFDFFCEARDSARALMAQPAPDHAGPGWLAGLPVAAKDYNDVGVR